MIYSKIEIAALLLLSENTIKNRIKLFGLVPHRKEISKTHYFDEEQIELIKENKAIYYDKQFKIYESKMNAIK
jgi:hypothetical protein